MQVPLLDLKPPTEELRAGLDAAYRRVLDSGWFLLGRELEAFEAEFAAGVGTRHCVGVANGLEALQLVLLARGIGPGDEVIVPANGYIATWLATHFGLQYVGYYLSGMAMISVVALLLVRRLPSTSH